MKAVILNTDNSVTCQELERSFALDTVDLTDLRTGLQFYASNRARLAFRARVAVEAGSPVVHLFGSGDFHHLTLMMLEQLPGRFLLVVFDNHLDCSSFGPAYHCGNWLYHAAKQPNCRMVLHCGATDGDGFSRRYDGTRGLIRKGKIKQVSGPDMTGRGSAERFMQLLAVHNPEYLPVYVSIDKDVLLQEEAPGDWDNGVMSRVQLRGMLERIVRTYPLAGADITGEKGGAFYYPSRPLKNILSWIEHRNCSDATPFAVAIAKQHAINVSLLKAFGVERVD